MPTLKAIANQFIQVAEKEGGEIAWSIEKENEWADSLPLSTKGVKEAFSDAFDP